MEVTAPTMGAMASAAFLGARGLAGGRLKLRTALEKSLDTGKKKRYCLNTDLHILFYSIGNQKKKCLNIDLHILFSSIHLFLTTPPPPTRFPLRGLTGASARPPPFLRARGGSGRPGTPPSGLNAGFSPSFLFLSVCLFTVSARSFSLLLSSLDSHCSILAPHNSPL